MSYLNEEDTEKVKNGQLIKNVGDIVNISGPRPVISRRGREAELLEFIDYNTNGFGMTYGENWKVKFIKNGEEQNHLVSYTNLT